jgi:hypothetical protein
MFQAKYRSKLINGLEVTPMDKAMHGGKREGAGRKPSDYPRRQRPLAASDKEWEQIKALAKNNGLSTNEYIIRQALNKDGE